MRLELWRIIGMEGGRGKKGGSIEKTGVPGRGGGVKMSNVKRKKQTIWTEPRGGGENKKAGKTNRRQDTIQVSRYNKNKGSKHQSDLESRPRRLQDREASRHSPAGNRGW